MDSREESGFRMGIDEWLLVALVASVVLFICSLVTPAWNGLVWMLSSIVWLVDVRNWSKWGWFAAVVVFVVILLRIQWWLRRNR